MKSLNCLRCVAFAHGVGDGGTDAVQSGEKTCAAGKHIAPPCVSQWWSDDKPCLDICNTPSCPRIRKIFQPRSVRLRTRNVYHTPLSPPCCFCTVQHIKSSWHLDPSTAKNRWGLASTGHWRLCDQPEGRAL